MHVSSILKTFQSLFNITSKIASLSFLFSFLLEVQLDISQTSSPCPSCLLTYLSSLCFAFWIISSDLFSCSCFYHPYLILSLKLNNHLSFLISAFRFFLHKKFYLVVFQLCLFIFHNNFNLVFLITIFLSLNILNMLKFYFVLDNSYI